MLWSVILPALVAAKADYYYRPCAKLLLKNGTYASSMASMSMSSADMYSSLCASADFAASLGQCIVTAASLTDESIPEQDRMHRVSWEYNNYICQYYGFNEAWTWDQTLADIAADPVTGGFDSARILVPASTLSAYNVPEAGIAWHRGRGSAVWFGWAAVAYTLLVLAVQTIFNFMRWYMPRMYRCLMQFSVLKSFRWQFSLPPALGPKASRTLSNFSQRLHYLWIAILCVLNVVFAAVDLDGLTFSPLYNTKLGSLTSFVGYRTGYLAMYQLPLVFLFAARNNILIYLTGWDMSVFNLWHRWLARLVVLQAIAHGAAYHIMDSSEGTIQSSWVQSYWIWGFVALMSWAIMSVHGAAQLRRLAYDVFLVGHIVLSIVALIGMHVHLWYTDQTKAAWYICIAFWAADRLLRLVRIAVNGFAVKATVTQDTQDTLSLHVHTPHRFKFYSGSYVFVHFCGLFWWQSHPFTVVPTETGLRLVMKPRNGVTKWLLRQCTTGRTTVKVMVDGPYGTPVNFAPFDTVSFIAGGVGITAIYSHLCSMTPDQLERKNVSLDWIVSSKDAVDYFRPELEELKRSSVELRIHVTNTASDSVSEVLSELPEKQALISEVELESPSASPAESAAAQPCPCSSVDRKREFLLKKPTCHNVTQLDRIVMLAASQCQQSLAYFVCGPASLIRDARERAALQAGSSSKYIQVFDEAFSM